MPHHRCKFPQAFSPRDSPHRLTNQPARLLSSISNTLRLDSFHGFPPIRAHIHSGSSCICYSLKRPLHLSKGPTSLTTCGVLPMGSHALPNHADVRKGLYLEEDHLSAPPSAGCVFDTQSFQHSASRCREGRHFWRHIRYRMPSPFRGPPSPSGSAVGTSESPDLDLRLNSGSMRHKNAATKSHGQNPFAQRQVAFTSPCLPRPCPCGPLLRVPVTGTTYESVELQA